MSDYRAFLDDLKAYRRKLTDEAYRRELDGDTGDWFERPRHLDELWLTMPEEVRAAVAAEHNAECKGDGISLKRRDNGHWYFLKDEPITTETA